MELKQRILPTSQIPFYELLSKNYREWVPKFLTWEKLQPEVRELERERGKVEQEPLSRDVFLKRLRPYYEAAQTRKIAFLSQHLQEYRQANNPCDPFESIDRFLKQMGGLTDVFFPLMLSLP